MIKYVKAMGILLCVSLMVSAIVGCGKKQSAQTDAGSSGEVAKSPVAQVTPQVAPDAPKPVVRSSNPLADLMKKQSGLTSYVMTMKMGAQDMKSAMKMENGKPVRIRTDMGAMGWTLVQYDKGVQYMGNSKTNVAMEIPLKGSQHNAPSTMIMPSAEALKSYKIESETLDGVDCLKVSKADSSTTVWMEKEHGLPVQMIMGGKPMKLKYEQVNAVPDSAFELPAGVQVQKAPTAPGR